MSSKAKKLEALVEDLYRRRIEAEQAVRESQYEQKDETEINKELRYSYKRQQESLIRDMEVITEKLFDYVVEPIMTKQ